MKEIINILVTCTLFMLAIQLYVLDSKSLAQTEENASEEFFNEGDEQLENEAQYLETDDEEVREDRERGERTFEDRIHHPQEPEPLEEKKPEGVRIEEDRSPRDGEDNLPAQPPADEIKIEL